MTLHDINLVFDVDLVSSCLRGDYVSQLEIKLHINWRKVKVPPIITTVWAKA